MTDRLKPKLLKYCGKKCRMLETIAAAVSVDQFRLNAVEIETYTTTQQDVVVLEWYKQQMRAQQAC